MTNNEFLLGDEALAKGRWVKLICGASNQDLAAIADLCRVYGSAGVHCIDVSADAAVVKIAKEALDWVEAEHGFRPWLMISLSDGKDNHFRKAKFDPILCPPNCSRPCEKVCPAKGIEKSGVINHRCYGCGRCLPICPLGLITEEENRIDPKEFSNLLSSLRPDAVEIHTAIGRKLAFEETINELMKTNFPLKRMAVSCGLKQQSISAGEFSKELWDRYSTLRNYGQKPIWQIDGREMSGDIGQGTARVSVRLWEKISETAPPGPIQLAGGTNEKTICHLPLEGGPAGIAFGSQARKLIQPWLLEAQAKNISLIDWPEGWEESLKRAKNLIKPWLIR